MSDPIGLSAEGCRWSECEHKMFPRCPNCNREIYAVAVFAFSHGDIECSCGHKVEVDGE